MRNALYKEVNHEKEKLKKVLPSQKKIQALHRLNRIKDSFAIAVENYSQLIKSNAKTLYMQYQMKQE